jgi:DNA mismatch endonuclease, patch repair protein
LVDVLTPEQRSYCMSHVRSRDTKPELRLRRALWAAGLRYRYGRSVFGKPDLVFPGKRIAVFIDGCFWHQCPVHATFPQTRRAFWKAKLNRNVERDREVTQELSESGWTVLRFWEHDAKQDLARVVRTIKAYFRAATHKRGA